MKIEVYELYTKYTWLLYRRRSGYWYRKMEQIRGEEYFHVSFFSRNFFFQDIVNDGIKFHTVIDNL